MEEQHQEVYVPLPAGLIQALKKGEAATDNQSTSGGNFDGLFRPL